MIKPNGNKNKSEQIEAATPQPFAPVLFFNSFQPATLNGIIKIK